MSIMRGTKPFPNSLCKRSASTGFRTEPNTRNPFEISTFVVPQPIPVETPVTTTSLLLDIASVPIDLSLRAVLAAKKTNPAGACQVSYATSRETGQGRGYGLTVSRHGTPNVVSRMVNPAQYSPVSATRYPSASPC